MVDVSAPRAGEPWESALDAALKRRFIPVHQRLLAFAVKPHPLAVVGRRCMLRSQPMRAKQTDHRAVHEQGAKLLHEVKRKAGAFVGRSVQHSERRLEPRGEQRGRALPQQDRLPIGKGGVRRRTRPGKLAQICAAPGKAEHVDALYSAHERAPAESPTLPVSTMRLTARRGIET